MLPSDALPHTLPALVDAAAHHWGDAPFLEEGAVRMSFAEARARIREVAAALMAQGIERGDRVAVWAPNVHEWVIAALGAQYAGAILVTLNTRYKGSEAGWILRRSRARALFCIGQFLGTDYPLQLADEALPDLRYRIVFGEPSSATGCIAWRDFLASGNTLPSSEIDARRDSLRGDDVADILFTSGTTGDPKGVMAGHAQNVRTFRHFSEIVGFQPGERYLVINPFFHSFGYKAGILACLLSGVTLLPHAVFNVDEVLRRISEDRIHVLPGPPTLFQSLLAHPALDQHDLSTLRRATTGAAVIPVEMIHQMKQRLGIETVITAYGLTESCGLVTMCRAGDSADTIATTSGRVIPDVELRCVNAAGLPVEPGEPGEIVVRGFNVMLGYFENPTATHECIDGDGWLHTGDIGILDTEGNLRITDRLKDMFITGGFNCYPAEIEKMLAAHPSIAMSAVIGIADDRMGEVAKAFVVLKPGHTLEKPPFIAWCRERMANYKVPREVEFVEALPLNASGKVLKTELRKRHA